MKQLILALTILLASCAGPDTSNCQIIHLKNHEIVITHCSVGKYTQVRFATSINIEGVPLVFYGSNGNTGYYYKKYCLDPGDTLIEDIHLVIDGERLYIEDKNLDKYQIK